MDKLFTLHGCDDLPLMASLRPRHLAARDLWELTRLLNTKYFYKLNAGWLRYHRETVQRVRQNPDLRPTVIARAYYELVRIGLLNDNGPESYVYASYEPHRLYDEQEHETALIKALRDIDKSLWTPPMPRPVVLPSAGKTYHPRCFKRIKSSAMHYELEPISESESESDASDEEI